MVDNADAIVKIMKPRKEGPYRLLQHTHFNCIPCKRTFAMTETDHWALPNASLGQQRLGIVSSSQYSRIRIHTCIEMLVYWHEYENMMSDVHTHLHTDCRCQGGDLLAVQACHHE